MVCLADHITSSFLKTGYFPVNFVKYLRAPFLQNTSGDPLEQLLQIGADLLQIRVIIKNRCPTVVTKIKLRNIK